MKVNKVLAATIFAAVAVAVLVFFGLDDMRLETEDDSSRDARKGRPGDTQPAELESKTDVPTASAILPVQLWSTPSELKVDKSESNYVSFATAQSETLNSKGPHISRPPGSLGALAAVKRGHSVLLPLHTGEKLSGRVNLVQQDTDGWLRVGGELTGTRPGSFSLASNDSDISGMILLPNEQIAYAISALTDGRVLIDEKRLSDVICFPLPRPRDEPVTNAQVSRPKTSPPILSSRPEATAVLYLDFDGETVTDPDWNGGNTIVAQPSSLTSAQMTEVWQQVKEDYWAFRIDVTTDRNRYNNAPVGSRMRCIITPTDTAEPGAGGVAYLNSFDQAGTSFFSSTIPCWVFLDSRAKSVAEAVSHELGHTFGLHHDGRSSPVEEYYEGHGVGAVGWAPIMGVGYYSDLVQWSKGEYAYANQQEDDLAIIANAANGFGYVADDAGNSIQTAVALNAPGGTVSQSGIISGATDADYYAFLVGNATVTINANPAPVSPNLDIHLELRDSVGTILASSNPDTALSASINRVVSAGTYCIKVQGTGRGAIAGDGYSNYGSIGQYSLSGTVPPAPPMIITQPASQSVPLGEAVNFSVAASGAQPLTYQWRFNGTNISGATMSNHSVANAQTNQAGSYRVVVRNLAGAITSSVAVLTVVVPPSIIAQPQNRTVTAGSSATFSVTASGSPPLNYQWFRTDAALAGATAASYTISAVQPESAGDYRVRVSNTAGAVDSALASLNVQYAPVITRQPESQNLITGESVMLVVGATAVPPPNYQWRFNGVSIAGATSSAYTIANFQPNNAGSYEVVVSNSIGSITSSSAAVAAAICTPAPQGLVGWWPGEDNAVDVAGGNSGVLLNGATFAAGKIGQAFSFDGVKSYIRVLDATNLHLTNGLTIEAWIYPTSLGSWHNIVSKWGIPNALQTAYTTALLPDGRLVLAVCASGNESLTPSVSTLSTNSVLAGRWAHFAVTYDGSALRTYLNGVCEDEVEYDKGIFPGTDPLIIGAAGAFSDGTIVSPFAGRIDEPTIYSRALSPSEIATICLAGAAGKCSLPPFVLTQPKSQRVVVGEPVTISVVAGGTPTLDYQWQFAGTNIAGATNSSFTITSASTNHAGNYSVGISSSLGQANSTVAVLTVQVPLPGIYDTGVSDGRTVLADGLVDPHYRLMVNPNNPSSSNSVVLDSTLFPIVSGPWIQNSSKSKWIGPVRNTGNALAGTYSYHLTLDLTGYDPETALLAGSWAADDNGSIMLNGVNTGYTCTNNFASFSTFALTNGFVPGRNLVEFRVGNGGYWTGLRVENLRGAASLKLSPPVVRVQPLNQTATTGDVVTFAVSSDGTQPLAYQWVFNGDAIPGATQSSFTIPGVTASDAGKYSVTISNSVGQTNSQDAILIVSGQLCRGFAIATQRFVDLRGRRLRTDSFDSADPRYSTNHRYDTSKTKDNGNIGANEGFLDAMNIGNAHIRGHVRVGPGTNSIIINSGAVGDSNFVATAEGGSIKDGWATTDFNTIFPAALVPNYDWLPLWPYKEDGSYFIGTGGQYRINNLSAGLTVDAPAGSVVQIRIDGDVYLSGVENITITPRGAQVIIYMTGTTFSLTGGAIIDNQSGIAADFFLFGDSNCKLIRFGGNADFYGGIYAPQADFFLGGGGADDYDFVGTSVTRTATMIGHYNFHFDEYFARVGPCPPQITAQPTDKLLVGGEQAVFSVSATGPALAFQWQLNGTTIVGATNDALVIESAKATDVGAYSVVVTNSWGIATSLTATLLLKGPIITKQPQPVIAVAGGSASFSVEAQGTAPMTFQWQTNGGVLPGQTNAVLTITNAQPVDFTEYQVLVSDAGGSVLSGRALLIQAQSPQMTVLGLNLTTLTLSFPTQPGPVYVVEYADQLNDPTWQVLTMAAGTGEPVIITQNVLTTSMRFYRIRMQ